MNYPAMYYLNVGFTWFITAVAIVLYFYVRRAIGTRWLFFPLFAAAYGTFAVSHSLLLGGVSANEWYVTLLRVLGYAVLIASIVSLAFKIKSQS